MYIYQYGDQSPASFNPPEDNREIIGYCDVCGEPIREGDDHYYFYTKSIYVCESCADEARRCG